MLMTTNVDASSASAASVVRAWLPCKAALLWCCSINHEGSRVEFKGFFVITRGSVFANIKFCCSSRSTSTSCCECWRQRNLAVNSYSHFGALHHSLPAC